MSMPVRGHLSFTGKRGGVGVQVNNVEVLVTSQHGTWKVVIVLCLKRLDCVDVYVVLR